VDTALTPALRQSLNLKRTQRPIMTNEKVFFIVFLLISIYSCRNSGIYKPGKYEDKIVSRSNLSSNISQRSFIRHEWLYKDQYNGKKIISREVFIDGKLMYKFPVYPQKPIIKWISSKQKNYISIGMIDTLIVQSESIPRMNRSIVSMGGTITQISDTSYALKAIHLADKITVYVLLNYNLEELNNFPNTIIDSLRIPIE
jgi:hypothetical protein